MGQLIMIKPSKIPRFYINEFLSCFDMNDFFIYEYQDEENQIKMTTRPFSSMLSIPDGKNEYS